MAHQFKVGDLVKLTRPDPQWYSEMARKDRIGEVVEIVSEAHWQLHVHFPPISGSMPLKFDQVDLVSESGEPEEETIRKIYAV